MILYLTRHGQTDYNIEKRLTGSSDIPLNETGISQAEAIAESLADVKIDVILSSPLQRALKTSQIIAEKHENLPIITMDGLMERNMGVCEGLEYGEATERHPELDIVGAIKDIDAAPEGGESLREFDRRVSETLDEIKAKYQEKTVLVVCHGLTSRIINKCINNLTYDKMNEFLLYNCQVVKYEI